MNSISVRIDALCRYLEKRIMSFFDNTVLLLDPNPHQNMYIFMCLLDPACQAINLKDKCYRLDPSCPTGYDKNNETLLGVSEIKDPNVVIYSVLGAIIVLLVTIIVFLLWERYKLKKGIHKAVCRLILIK